MTAPIPIFPLNAVLFPDGILSLRVFEARYMDMVRDSLKNETPFGVCLIRKGRETGAPAEPEVVGCLASITHWDMEQLGVLNIRVRGSERFRILNINPDAQGLHHAVTQPLAADPARPIGAQAAACVTLLRRVIGEIEEKKRAQNPGEAMDNLPIATPYRFDNAAWVANRLCEVLQIPLKAKQKLMELDDAEVRLSLVQQYLQQHKVI
ncbi:MAG: ATP-dependent protease [Burkholderiaceae bacterium]|nr:MAG: ATP-dependent protease [Burkholderiaceae bacterium]